MALNWLWVSSYGSLIPSDGCVFIRYSAASAIWIGLSGTVILPLYFDAVDRPTTRSAPASPASCCRAACSGPTAARCRSACRRPCWSGATGTPAEVLEVRDLRRVDRLDVLAVDQPQARVARGRDHVVLVAAAGAHQRHHLVGRARVLRVDLAAALLLERLHPVGLRDSPPTRPCSAFRLAAFETPAAGKASRIATTASADHIPFLIGPPDVRFLGGFRSRTRLPPASPGGPACPARSASRRTAARP